MSDLASALDYVTTNERIVDSTGNVIAERERRRGLKALLLSQLIVDATGQPLFKVVCRVSRHTSRVDVFTPSDAPVAHIKGRSWFTRPNMFTIRDGSGLVIGRIEGPRWISREFRLLDNEGRLRARGVRTGRKEGAEWAVEIEGDHPLASPWPELTAAYFLSRRALSAPILPP